MDDLKNGSEELKNQTDEENHSSAQVSAAGENTSAGEKTSAGEETSASAEISSATGEKSSTDGKKSPAEKKSSLKEKKSKKKKPLALRIILFPFKIILILLIVILAWFTFCFFDKTPSLQALPKGFSLYVRSDSVWDTFNPLLDLDASLVFLSSPQMQDFREPFLEIKKSKLRENIFVQKALKRRIDFALYDFSAGEKSESFDEAEEKSVLSAVGVLNAGVLAGATRLVPFVIEHFSFKGFEIETHYNSYGKYYSVSDSVYFVIHKNLVVFTFDNSDVLKIMSFSNQKNYSEYERKILDEKLEEPLRIIADSSNLVQNFSSFFENPQVSEILASLSDDEFAVINFGISQNDLYINAVLPLSLKEDDENPVLTLLKKDSDVPSLLPKLSDSIQYYTLINAGSLSELKNAAFALLPADKKAEETWKTADNTCRFLFRTPLDEILFSWTSDEFIAFGIEGKNEPVFGIKIADEQKRKEIFDTVFSSLILQTNDSLLVDGIRLPCIELPPFMLSIVNMFGVNVPRPYYLIADGFIFFSESPENLVSFNSALKKDSRISRNENWKKVSSKQSLYSTLSLYYNLERSIPFFVKGNSTLSKIIRLYNIGRFDVEIKDGNVTLTLQSATVENGSSLTIPGFPMTLGENADHYLVKSNAKNSNMIFYLEKDGTVNSLNCQTFEKNSISVNDVEYLVAASAETAKQNGGEVWALTKQGLCYLLDKNLLTVKGFPLLLGVSTLCRPTIYDSSLLVVGKDCVLYVVSPDGGIKEIQTSAEDNIRSTPSVMGEYIAFYEKGFFGGVHILKNLEPYTPSPLEIDGIAYDSPCLFSSAQNSYAAIVSQSGTLYVFDLATLELVPGFPIELNDIFYLNVRSADGNIFAVSEQGTLYKVSLDKTVTWEKIPHFSAKEGFISVFDYDDDKKSEIFISGQGNMLYGFSSDMELLYNFPVSGFGNPVFTDLNGDNKKDCLVITFDNKLNAVNVLK